MDPRRVLPRASLGDRRDKQGRSSFPIPILVHCPDGARRTRRGSPVPRTGSRRESASISPVLARRVFWVQTLAGPKTTVVLGDPPLRRRWYLRGGLSGTPRLPDIPPLQDPHGVSGTESPWLPTHCVCGSSATTGGDAPPDAMLRQGRSNRRIRSCPRRRRVDRKGPPGPPEPGSPLSLTCSFTHVRGTRRVVVPRPRRPSSRPRLRPRPPWYS